MKESTFCRMPSRLMVTTPGYRRLDRRQCLVDPFRIEVEQERHIRLSATHRLNFTIVDQDRRDP